ncbi:MAG: dihydrodipicolinate synthase family protein, partial [Spirochaetota bacterium]
MNNKLKGVIPALITPLKENRTIDLTLLERQVCYLVTEGVHGFFVNGTTGEGLYLAKEERRLVLQTVKDVSKGRTFICAACIQPSTEQTIREIENIADIEPDFIVAVVPLYYAVSQSTIIHHFRQISKSSPNPLVLYNIPQCTGNRLELETVLELSELPNIAGIKDSSGDFSSFSRGMFLKKNGFRWIQGEDYLDGPSLSLGAPGIVTGLGNIWIQPYVRMFKAAEIKDAAEIENCQKQINQLYGILRINGIQNIAAIKAGTSL